MTIERAIEILDPNHREHYDSIDTVNEACIMGMEALKTQQQGEWEKNGDWFMCSLCGNFVIDVYPFCPYCGAVMGVEE